MRHFTKKKIDVSISNSMNVQSSGKYVSQNILLCNMKSTNKGLKQKDKGPRQSTRLFTF